MPITHQFVSAVTDDEDPDLVGPDEWNEDHVVDGYETVEAWDDVIADLSGDVVHRWKFEETSGYPQDVVGSLHFVSGGGTITRSLPSPTGDSMLFTASMATSGLGSLPVGGTYRTFVIISKVGPGTGAYTLLAYGPTGSTRQWNHICWNHDGYNQCCYLFWSDDHKPGFYGSDGGWHMLIARYATRAVNLNVDGIHVHSAATGATINTGTSGNLTLGEGTSDRQFSDIIVFDSWLTNYEVARLGKAWQAAVQAFL